MTTTTPQQAIENILAASGPNDLFDRNNLERDFREYAKVIHPDRAGELPNIARAMTRLQQLRDLGKQQIERGTWSVKVLERPTYRDDAGSVYKRGQNLYFGGEDKAVTKSAEIAAKLRALRDDAAQHFQRYLVPAYQRERVQEGTDFRELFSTQVAATAVCVANPRIFKKFPTGLPQKHVAWILSRFLEVVAWFHQTDRVHAGLVPESVYVDPETHGIQVVSFYHMTRLGERLRTVSGKYQNWYPPSVFRDKIASPDIDLAMVKRIASFLLGDPSGHGARLRMNKDIDAEFVDFLLRTDHDAHETFKSYRSTIRRLHGEPKFHVLEL